MPIITVPKVLRDKLGEDGADALVELFNQSEAQQKEDMLQFVEEKFERRLSEEVGKINQRITNETESLRVEIQQTRTDLFDRIERSHTDLVDRVETSRSDLIKWVFIFWVGQVGVIIGILFAFFK